MTERSIPATGGVTDDPIRLGTLLYTLVEPHRGHQVAYNRWYERDHFYAGCQIGAYNFSGARFVATADQKELRLPDPSGLDGPSPVVPDPQVGTYLGLYYVLAGHHAEWNRWAVDQVNALHAAGRMFARRDHIHTGLYRFEWEYRRDEDGVPAELTLDHRFPALVSVFTEAARGTDPTEVGEWYRNWYLPSVLPGSPVATVLGFSPLPLLADAPGDVPRDTASDRRLLLLCFLDDDPSLSWESVFEAQGEALAGSGLGRLVWASPFVATVPGTDTYTDRLWAE
ncbi:MAG: hypothetical protein ACYCV7_04065 [Acidimicrobiales bacterium]